MTMENRRIVFITHARFWRLGVGFWQRTQTLLSYLADRFEVDVYFLGDVNPADRESFDSLPQSIRCTALAAVGAKPRKHRREQFRREEEGKPQACAYFIDKIENSFILPALPRSAVTILDTHDLVYARTAKERRHRVRPGFPLSPEQEKRLMRKYSAVLCIQSDEYDIVRNWVGKDRALLVPHPVVPKPQPLKAKVRSIGIVASGWHANVHGLRHFLEHIWPKLADLELNMLIYGAIASRFDDFGGSRIKPMGFEALVEDCYRRMDIAINPVYYGAGLKIKSVEAMSFGVPLVTTPEGASGLERYANRGLVVARDDAEFVALLRRLATSNELRKRIATGAVDIVSRNFSQKTCFAPLGKFLNSIRG